MRNAVLDPAVLFISQEDFRDEKKRDGFLDHLLGHMDSIDRYSVARILWSDDLESCLWEEPEMPPWLRGDWRNRMVPAVYMLLQKNRQPLDCIGTGIQCGVVPQMACSSTRARTCFLSLMHQAITAFPDVVLCLGLDNLLRGVDYVFSCDCCRESITPDVVGIPNDWLHHVDVEDRYWPRNRRDVRSLDKALEITRSTYLPHSDFLYRFEYSPQFAKDIVGVRDNRGRILRQMARRLTMTEHEAASDGSLRDEVVHSSGERRFRVTPKPSSTRIHYVYKGSKALLFKRYYDAGHHDDGL